MFPLGSVLMPTLPLPLHVFEPRYRALVRDCLAGDREFGVVLIERGSEVGGHDVRSNVGTVARIVEAAELPDGRWAIGAIGDRRLRVQSWLPDDPYPQAEVADWPDAAPGPGFDARLGSTVSLLRQALALAAEAGEAVAPATIALSADGILATHQACAVAPIGPLDQQRLLSAATPEARLEALSTLLTEVIEVLRFRLGGG